MCKITHCMSFFYRPGIRMAEKIEMHPATLLKNQ